ncbi:MAG TPA: hypothetical protein PK246_02185 [Saprospiraceae bacterium]|nr:hypothetical protein [Lewinellaceae bacterium]HPK09118.1 hypothetical protein [Saprospiraceae bacterium]
MKHSKVVPLIILKNERFSILQIAKLIINFYQNLVEKNSLFNIINIISEKETIYSVIDIQKSNSIEMLAEEILHRNLEDIRKIDGVDNPNLDYRRGEKGGIHIGLETKIENDTFISLTFSFYPYQNAVGRLVVNELCFDTFEKAKDFLTAANNVFSVKYSAIKITDRLLNKIASEYRAPLGWITYFSFDYDIPIPNDLDGIEIEYICNGKYLILSKEDISVQEEKLELCKQKIISTMKQIENKCPDYSRKE